MAKVQKPRSSRYDLAGLLAVFAALGVASCGSAGPAGGVPVVPLSASVEAQNELHTITSTWAQASREERLRLEPRLIEFHRRFPEDPLGPVIDALLAWIAVERGELDKATSLAKQVHAQVGENGTTADLARMVEGAALRRAGNPSGALAKLRPLEGKLIDAWARAYLNDEAMAAALGAKRYAQAVDLMVASLHEAAPDERTEVQAHLDALLATVPSAELVPILDERRKKTPEPTGDELLIQRLLVERLAEAAQEDRDAALASHLVGTSGPLLGDKADAIADLSVGAGVARVEAPTLGLLLPLRSPEARRRGTQVASGVTHGLGLPGSMARLVSRDDRGRIESVEEALEGLSADGAAVMIAGIDREEATVAARFAAREGIPVVLLHPPAPDVAASPFVFVLGEEPEVVRSTLVAALPARGTVLTVGDRGEASMAKETDFDCDHVPQAWRGTAAVAVYGSCVGEVLMSVAGTGVKCAVGLDVGGTSLPRGTLALSAGAYPVDPREVTNDALRAWLRTHPDPPSIWAGLGRDAAVLAWTGVQVLPPKGTKDPAEVKARRVAAATALAQAQAELWTSEAKGFGGGRKLPRKLGVREVR
jgi:hypothetical protein